MSKSICIEHSFWKPEKCDHCGDKYVYKMTRKGYGTSESEDKKELLDNATENLKNKFKNEFDNTPCPSCSCYQDKMVTELKWLKSSEFHAYSVAGIMLSTLLALYVVLLKVTGSLINNISERERDYDLVDFISYGELLHMYTATAIVLFLCLLFVLVRRAIYNPNKGKKTAAKVDAMKAEGSVYSNKDFKAKVTQQKSGTGGLLAGAALGGLAAYGISNMGSADQEIIDNGEMPSDIDEVAEAGVADIESIESIDDIDLDESIDNAFAEAGFDDMDVDLMVVDIDTDLSDFLDV